MKRNLSKVKLAALFIAVVLIAVTLLTACSAGSADKDYDYGGPSDNDDGEKTDSSIVIGSTDRKIVYRVELTIYSDTPEEVCSDIAEATTACDGYVENSRESKSEYGESYYFVARIPTAKLDDFVNDISVAGTVKNKEVTTEDITVKYVTVDEQRKSLLAEKDALTARMSEATEISDIIAISDRLAQIDAEINAAQRQLNEFDNLLDYSTVTIYVNKNYTETPDTRTFGKKLGDLFVASFKSIATVFNGIVIGLTAALPYLIIIACVVGLALFIVFGVKNIKKTGKFFPQKKDKKTAPKRKSEKTEISEAATDKENEKTEPNETVTTEKTAEEPEKELPAEDETDEEK